MTTLFSTPITVHQTPAIPRGRVALVALWLTQIALAGMFLVSGGLKLTGAPELVALFDAIGIGQWFHYVTGSIEVVSAVALLVPSWAAFGAVLLIPTMVGAVATHLFIVGGSAAPATILLIGSLAIAWARRDQLASWRGGAERLPFVRNRSFFF
jgi:putative oxidoreductase